MTVVLRSLHAPRAAFAWATAFALGGCAWVIGLKHNDDAVSEDASVMDDSSTGDGNDASAMQEEAAAEATADAEGSTETGAEACVPAAYENCFNTADDDCDGVVNNGCPKSLSVGGDRILGRAGGDGGIAKTIHCPVGAFVTRVDSWGDAVNAHASGVSIYCATPGLVQGATAYSVALVPNTPTPYATATGATSPTDDRQDDCGIQGLTAITYSVGLADNYVEALGHHCGTSAVVLQPDNTIVFDFTTTGSMTYTSWSMTGTAFDEACASNEVVVGFALRQGNWLDDLAPICAELSVTYM
jgi:hypothetical protein